ncbi:glycosyltransferase [Candidatus Daviesbacteria bacterium]|nr:glycosyltransferase [Candidatus Daviesbacteria bacterium]
MKVAIVHDDLVQWGGAERVLEGLLEIYPDAPIYTSVYAESNQELKKRFGNKKIITSFLQKIPGWRALYRALLPVYPIAFEQFDFTEFDLVISHTTRFAKSIITKPGTTHVCYCHTPPRFLWHFSGLSNYGLGEILMTNLRLYDQVSAKRVDFFLAGSENARKRIKRVYGVDSKVVYPFIDLDRFKNVETFDGGYYVVMGRPNKYKRFDLAQKASLDLKMITGGLSERMLVNILAGCKALIVPGEEDFGLSSLEAQALGKPVIAYKKGGSLETVIDKKTGIFFEESLESALLQLHSLKINPQNCKENAAKFSKEVFIESFKQAVARVV